MSWALRNEKDRKRWSGKRKKETEGQSNAVEDTFWGREQKTFPGARITMGKYWTI